MIMTEELKQIYANHENTNRYYETLQVTSSAWNDSVYIINEPISHSFKIETQEVIEFLPYPFGVKLPDVGSEQQDMSIQLDGTFQELIVRLEQATDANAPMTLTYRIYRDGVDYQQANEIILNVSSVSLKGNIVSLTCTRTDLFKRMFPAGDRVTFDSRFHGLLQ